MGKKQPQYIDPQSERSTLGGLLIEPDFADEVVPMLEPSDFTEWKNALVYEGIRALHSSGSPIDLVALDSWFASAGRLNEVGPVFIGELVNTCPNCAQTAYYAKIVLENSLARQTLFVGDALAHGQISAGEGIQRLDALIRRRESARRDSMFTLRELMAKELPATRYAIPTFAPEGLIIFASKAKIGKSWLALHMGLAVAAGGNVLGESVEQGEALYLALEDGPKRLQKRARMLLADGRVPEGLTIATQWEPLHLGGLARMERWLKTHKRARLVVIDVFAKVQPPRSRNGNPYAEDYAVMSSLKALADAYHVALVVIHHTRKASAEDVFDEINGTSGIGGAADTLLVLQRQRGETEGVLHITGREVEREARYAVKFDPATCLWSLTGDAPPEADLSASRQRIVTTLRELSKATPKQVAAYLGKNESTTRTLLVKMAAAGEIKSNNNGTYSTVDFVDSVDAATDRKSTRSTESTPLTPLHEIITPPSNGHRHSLKARIRELEAAGVRGDAAVAQALAERGELPEQEGA